MPLNICTGVLKSMGATDAKVVVSRSQLGQI